MFISQRRYNCRTSHATACPSLNQNIMETMRYDETNKENNSAGTARLILSPCAMASAKSISENDISNDTKGAVRISFGMKKKEQRVQTGVNLLNEDAQNIDDEASSEVDGDEKRSPLTHFEDGAFPQGKVDSKKLASDLVIPLVKENDWRIQRLLKLKNEGELSEEERAKLELLAETVSPSLNIDTKVVLYVLHVSVVPLKLPPRRPKGLGLGADLNIGKPDGKKESSDGKEDSGVGPLKKFSYVKITGGAHRDCYGKVQSFDEDNASVIVELAIGGNNVRVSEYAVVLVSAKEYERDAKCINKRDYDREKRRIERRNREENGKEAHEGSSKSYEKEKKKRALDRGNDKTEKKRKSDTTIRQEGCSERRMWVRPELRVRFIDKHFKDGKLYNEKVRVLDAADCENCTIKDSAGKTYYQIREDWLETVIPRDHGARLMILRGPLRGQVGIMEQKNKRSEEVLIRVLMNDELTTLSFDDACEWLGVYEDD
ncbi:Protein mos-2 -like protein [Toxocara canis]|uniref:Protein mos-2-like protein n=1 Tax=Toxocara canis TaxID=6265 RepID=A0A0B2VUB2_TOXCA|nr:Protein mos-2 -like protein [Toxocara canis]